MDFGDTKGGLDFDDFDDFDDKPATEEVSTKVDAASSSDGSPLLAILDKLKPFCNADVSGMSAEDALIAEWLAGRIDLSLNIAMDKINE